jgi:hypothetical protein
VLPQVARVAVDLPAAASIVQELAPQLDVMENAIMASLKYV